MDFFIFVMLCAGQSCSLAPKFSIYVNFFESWLMRHFGIALVVWIASLLFAQGGVPGSHGIFAF